MLLYKNGFITKYLKGYSCVSKISNNEGAEIWVNDDKGKT